LLPMLLYLLLLGYKKQKQVFLSHGAILSS